MTGCPTAGRGGASVTVSRTMGYPVKNVEIGQNGIAVRLRVVSIHPLLVSRVVGPVCFLEKMRLHFSVTTV
jgi:hypothetical protein